MEAEDPVEASCGQNIPTVYLSDVDDIPDIEGDVDEAVDVLHQTISSKRIVDDKRSIFNEILNLDEEIASETPADGPLETFRSSVMKAINDWEVLAMDTVPKSVGNQISTTYSPSPSDQAYLTGCPNMQAYLRGFRVIMDDSAEFIIQLERSLKQIDRLKDYNDAQLTNWEKSTRMQYLSLQ